MNGISANWTLINYLIDIGKVRNGDDYIVQQAIRCVDSNPNPNRLTHLKQTLK